MTRCAEAVVIVLLSHLVESGLVEIVELARVCEACLFDSAAAAAGSFRRSTMLDDPSVFNRDGGVSPAVLWSRRRRCSLLAGVNQPIADGHCMCTAVTYGGVFSIASR